MSAVRRVLLLSGEYPPMQGGVADFTAIVARHLVRQGCEVHVLTAQDAGAGPARDDGVHVHAEMASWGLVPLLRAVRRLVGRARPDVINIQYQTAAYDMRPGVNLLPRLIDVPVVTTFHDLLVPYLFPKAGPARWWVNRFLARQSQAVIVTNAQDRQRLQAGGGVERLFTVPIGSNVRCAPPADYCREAWRGRWGIPAEATVLCYFGFLNDSKGGEELVQALARLVSDGLDAWLVLIGATVGASDATNQAYLARVQALIATHGLEERVIWTGYLPEDEQVSAAFLAADLCLLPYRDGASFRRGSLMAALAHGLPIISTTPQVALPELRHGQNIWLVPPRDAAALAGAVIHLIRDPMLRQRLGQGARDLSRRFDWAEIAQRTLEVYRVALSMARAPRDG